MLHMQYDSQHGRPGEALPVGKIFVVVEPLESTESQSDFNRRELGLMIQEFCDVSYCTRCCADVSSA